MPSRPLPGDVRIGADLCSLRPRDTNSTRAASRLPEGASRLSCGASLPGTTDLRPRMGSGARPSSRMTPLPDARVLTLPVHRMARRGQSECVKAQILRTRCWRVWAQIWELSAMMESRREIPDASTRCSAEALGTAVASGSGIPYPVAVLGVGQGDVREASRRNREGSCGIS